MEGDKVYPKDIFLKKSLKIKYIRFLGGYIFSLLTFLFGLIFNLFKSKKELLVQILLHKKEIEILKRQQRKQRLGFQHSNRIIFSILNRIGHIKESLSIVKQETRLSWQHDG